MGKGGASADGAYTIMVCPVVPVVGCNSAGEGSSGVSVEDGSMDCWGFGVYLR